MKYLLILMLASCGTLRRHTPTKKVERVLNTQDRIIKCYEFVKTKGGSDKFAGKFCTNVFKGL